MTEQYLQEAIQLEEATPIVLTTPDATPVLVVLDVLSVDPSSIVISLSGGGSNPANPFTDNYTVTGQIIYERTTLVSPGVSTIVITPTGVAPTIVPLADGTPANRVLLEITGPAFPYTHRLYFSKSLLV